jgi:hypothetical protein
MSAGKRALVLWGVVSSSLLTFGGPVQGTGASWQPQGMGGTVELGMLGVAGSSHPAPVPPQALDTLPQTLSVLFGAPLAEAIHHSRNRAYPHGHPMPGDVRRALAPFFSRAILEKVRYSTEWNRAAEGTLQHFLLGQGHVDAVTLADVILFREDKLAEDPLLWAHELVHVEQYTRLGVETFATQYLQQAWVLEQEAIAKANAIREQLLR